MSQRRERERKKKRANSGKELKEQVSEMRAIKGTKVRSNKWKCVWESGKEGIKGFWDTEVLESKSRLHRAASQGVILDVWRAAGDRPDTKSSSDAGRSQHQTREHLPSVLLSAWAAEWGRVHKWHNLLLCLQVFKKRYRASVRARKREWAFIKVAAFHTQTTLTETITL